LWSKNEYNVENRKYTSSYSPVIVAPKHCKTSVVLMYSVQIFPLFGMEFIRHPL
jgi:hypothetical protein